jgi:hypothetical protein
VTRRPKFLIIAVLLTFLDVAVVVCRGWPVWATRSGDLWNRGARCSAGVVRGHVAGECLGPSGSRTRRSGFRPESRP